MNTLRQFTGRPKTTESKAVNRDRHIMAMIRLDGFGMQ